MAERKSMFIILVVNAVLWTGHLSKCQDPLCNDKLLQTLPDSHLTSSSVRGDVNLHAGPERGRLNTTETTLNNGTTLMGGWSPATDGQGTEYIQATFDEMTMINGVLSQGRNKGNEYMTSFKMEYTEDGVTWQTVNNDLGVEQIFMGNADSDAIVENTLDCPIFATGVRIIPIESANHIALRFDVSGCYVDNTVIVVTTPLTTTIVVTKASTPTASTPFLPGIITPFGGNVTTSAPNTSSMTSTVVSPTGTTINLLTLIHWFITALSNQSSTTPPMTSSMSTTPTTMLTTPTTIPTTPTTVLTTPTTLKTTTTTIKTTPSTIKTTTTMKTTPTSTLLTTTTPLYNFHPGIIDPFGTTRNAPQPTTLRTTTTTTTTPAPQTTKTTTMRPTTRTTTFPPFMPGILDPFGNGPNLIG